MGVLGESWCFCSGGGKSERLKATIFSNKSPAMARLSSSAGEATGSGFLMHKNLLLTTHVNLPSASAAESTEVRLQNDVVATLVPNRFFITSSVLDLTIVGLDSTEGDSNSTGPQPHHLKTYSNPNLDLGNVIYVLGYTTDKELTIDEGKVVIATDNLIKLSTQGVNWSPGSAGFDSQGNLAFMICDPMKLATSPYTNSSPSASSPSCKRDRETLFGIPMPIICGWLNQHLEPKEILMRLGSDGHMNDHPTASSLITNQVFDNNEAEDLNDSSPSNVIIQPQEEKKVVLESPKVTSIHKETSKEKKVVLESPKVTSITKETSKIPLLDIESDPMAPEDISSSGSVNEVQNKNESSATREPEEKNNTVLESPKVTPITKETSEIPLLDIESDPTAPEEISSSGSANGVQNEIESSPTHVAGSEVRDEMEKTNSAETAESRSNSSPREGKFKKSVSRWAVHRYAHKSLVEKDLSLSQPRKSFSQGGTSHRSNEYYTPTVTSIKKKRNSDLEKAKPAPKPVNRTLKTAVSSSPRWVI